ncbi:MAG: ABC transporter permease [Oscillospiraceae bacterium]|nr:ABC transporter permease [Oscillospiraceae bacterium]
MDARFERNTFGKRLKSMLKVDFRRMFTMRLFYIIAGSCLVAPILILVMTTMFGGADPETGETVEPMFTNVWQIISSISGGEVAADTSAEAASDMAAMSMDITMMCNMNMLYFAIAVLVCLFVSEDFKSGYSKNIFTVRAKKSDYVISKTAVCFVGSAIMILVFFIGSMLGGAIAGLPFDTGIAGIGGVVMCMISKILLTAVFVPIYLVLSVAAKQRTWLSMMISFGAGMLLFMMIPMMTPLNSGIMNVVLCLAGGAVFNFGLGAVSNLILKKTSLV